MSEEPPAAPGQIEAGSVLAGYRCEEVVGRGGMAVVYRAYDDRLDRRVALKILAPELARDDVFRARFIQESRIAAATEHPHIIPVFSAGEADGVLYLAMRYVPDGDVRTLIDRTGPLPVARACALIGQAASALDAAHARGLVHRDVKPTNMLLELSSRSSHPDHLYLSDFGLAKPSSAATGLTLTGQFFGTVDYVAPEQIQGNPLDGRTDQYALACTSFEMLCGEPPFKRDTGMAVISAHLSDAPPPLSARRPGLPAAVDAVIAKAMAKSPADRYERCLDFAEALLAATQTGQGKGEPVAATAYRPPTRPAAPAAAVAPVVPGTVADPPAGNGPRDLSIVPGFTGQPPTDPELATEGWWAGPGQPRPGSLPPGPPGRRTRRRSRTAIAASVIAVLVVVFLVSAGVTYYVKHGSLRGIFPGSAGSPSPTITRTVTESASNGPSSGPPGPAATVTAYYAAINAHQYGRAWRLGGRNTRTGSYTSFVNGYTTTAHDTVTIQSVSGNTVTARLSAEQTDGTVKIYQGTYTVTNGVITYFHVVLTS